MNEKTVGMLAKFTGVSVHTIKYYEKIGLLSSARREHSNYRLYDVRVCTDIYGWSWCIQSASVTCHWQRVQHRRTHQLISDVR